MKLRSVKEKAVTLMFALVCLASCNPSNGDISSSSNPGFTDYDANYGMNVPFNNTDEYIPQDANDASQHFVEFGMKNSRGNFIDGRRLYLLVPDFLGTARELWLQNDDIAQRKAFYAQLRIVDYSSSKTQLSLAKQSDGKKTDFASWKDLYPNAPTDLFLYNFDYQKICSSSTYAEYDGAKYYYEAYLTQTVYDWKSSATYHL